MAKRYDNNDFMSQFLGANPPDPTKLSKNTIHHDKWDQEEYNAILKEMDELSKAEDTLIDAVPTGGSAFADMFYALLKADPRLIPSKDVRPSHQINRAVMDEAVQLNEYQQMRAYTVGDVIATALSDIAMEPELEILFDKMKEQQKLADKIQEQLQQMQQMQQEAADLDEMIRQAMEGSEGEQGDPQNYQDQKALIQKSLEILKAQIEKDVEELEKQMGEAAVTIRASMKAIMQAGLKEAEQMDNMAQAWGLEPGVVQRMDAKERIELARRLSTDKFKRIAALFGPMHRMAFAEQQRKTIHAMDEIYDLELGDNLALLLPSELLNLEDELLELDFLRRFYEQSLLQYSLRGTERLARGGMVVCIDSSSSMTGDPEIWSKAVALSLLKIAQAQNRPYYGIHFGNPGALKCYDFTDSRKVTVDQVIDFAEYFMSSGTCFMTPLSAALSRLQAEHAATNSVKADIVFITDGQCGVDQTWLEELKLEQERIGFRIYGVILGGGYDSEPLKTICDGRVFTIQNFLSGEDMREIFRSV